jgi:thiamine pyrophosphate-dependent acetolactate synthase large subunit-like protein
MQFAASFGVAAFRVTGPDQFEGSLRQALVTDRPALVEVRAPQTAV